MAKESPNAGIRLAIGSLIFMLLAVVLKLFGVLSIPWVWIFSPFWISGLLMIGVVMVFVAIAVARSL